ncbi:MAG: DUF362 domain-containing protein [Nitrospinaceae bacterium]
MKSKVLLRKIDEYGLPEVERFVRDSVDLFQAASVLFRPGQRILLKPNLLRGFEPGRCVTTHPVVVEAVCRVLKDLSVNHIHLGDSPALGSLQAVARQAGYAPLVKRYGLRIVPLSNPVPLLSGENIPDLKIAGSLREYDHIINLPKFKSHCQMTLTLAIKNLFGLVIGKRKPVLHCLVKNDKVRFGRMLVDIARQVSPSLTIVDGIRAMEGNGPIHGNPYPLRLLASGQDLTAVDRVLAGIVRAPLDKMYALEAARQMNFGCYDLADIELVGETSLAALTVSDFKLAAYPVDISFNPLRLIKSFLKQFLEVGIKEKLTGPGNPPL